MQKISKSIIFYFGVFEYIILRIVRRFIFKGTIGKVLLPFLPYYKTNQNIVSPDGIVKSYIKCAKKAKLNLYNLNILEIGIGETNSTGYELIARFGGRFFAFDPFVTFDNGADKKSLELISKKHHLSKDYFKKKVTRISCLKNLKQDSIDVVLSNSVLEHVSNIDKEIKELKQVLKTNGCMIHIVDYRDHFFKYPYHFLIFSNKTWNTFLNPGDLYRYRLKDHCFAFKKNGYTVKILEEKTEKNKFEDIKLRIHPEFKKFSGKEISITQASLLVE